MLRMMGRLFYVAQKLNILKKVLTKEDRDVITYAVTYVIYIEHM